MNSVCLSVSNMMSFLSHSSDSVSLPSVSVKLIFSEESTMNTTVECLNTSDPTGSTSFSLLLV
jgi:hypothetical protein